jgi:DNA gyrase subunit A
MTEDLIAPEDMVVTLSHTGYIKSQPLADTARRSAAAAASRRRRPRKTTGSTSSSSPTPTTRSCASPTAAALYWLKVWEVPQGTRTSRGKPIVNMFPLAESEKITVVLPIKQYDEEHFVFMATAMGTVKKTRSPSSRGRARRASSPWTWIEATT